MLSNDFREIGVLTGGEPLRLRRRLKLEVGMPVAGRIDARRVVATTKADLKRQVAEDDATAAQDAALYARRVRRRIGLTQDDFAVRLGAGGYDA